MGAFEARDVDAVVIVGSDDLVTPAWLAYAQHLAGSLGAGVLWWAALPGLHYLDLKTGRLVRSRQSAPGAGRVVSRALLASVGWRPWPSGLARRLDDAMLQRLAPLRGVRRFVATKPGAVVLDIKTSVNLWSFDERAARERTLPVDDAGAWLSQHFPGFFTYEPMISTLTTNQPPRTMKTKRDPHAQVEMVALVTFRNRNHEGEVRRGQRFTTTGARADALEWATPKIAEEVPALPPALPDLPPPPPATPRPETVKIDGPETVKRVEPAPPVSLPLPDNFPGVELLRGAGLTTVSTVLAASDANLLSIRGLGRKTAKAIRAALKELL